MFTLNNNLKFFGGNVNEEKNNFYCARSIITKRKVLVLIGLVLVSSLAGMTVGAVVHWNINYNSILVVPVYCLLTFICLFRFSSTLGSVPIVSAILLGRSIPSINVIAGYLSGEVWSLPLFILTLIGIASGYLLWKGNSFARFTPFLIGIALAVLMHVYGWGYWIHYSNFGTFTGRVDPVSSIGQFAAKDNTGVATATSEFSQKLVLLDFWHTRCGVCFEKFPSLEAGYQKYKYDDSIMFLAVNKPLQEDEATEAFDTIRSKGYTFPVVMADDEDLPEKWGVKGYPTTFVLNRMGLIVYKGDIEGAVRMVDELRSKDE